jgi:hypothetical protein
MGIVDATLAAAERHATALANRSREAADRRAADDLARRGLWDARRWRSGYSGPPFGTFARARLRWWHELDAELRAADGPDVVLAHRQVADLIHLAELAERPLA